MSTQSGSMKTNVSWRGLGLAVPPARTGNLAIADQTPPCSSESAIKLLPEECEFYSHYGWSLNATPRVEEVIRELRSEVARLLQVPADWRAAEVMVNIYMLACAISDTVDDWLLGPSYNFSKVTGTLSAAKLVVRPVEAALKSATRLRAFRLRRFRRWRQNWEDALQDYVENWISAVAGDSANTVGPATGLLPLLDIGLHRELLNRRCRIPAAYRSQDMAHYDVVALALKFVGQYADRWRPVLVLGCRTAGSYFAPLFGAVLRAAGCAHVDSVTIRPKKGMSARERRKIQKIAQLSGSVVVIDEPIFSGSTMLMTMSILRQNGVARENITAAFPIHASRRDWDSGANAAVFAEINLITLEPDEWHKRQMLTHGSIEQTLGPYFEHNGMALESVVEDGERNALVDSLSDLKFHSRLKRVYEVRLRTAQGLPETRFVVAKSVGWGWFGYHSFLAARRLEGRVPPVLGLRDGVLFSEWVQAQPGAHAETPTEAEIAAATDYVAARVRHLPLTADPAPDLVLQGEHKGLDELAGILRNAYGWKPVAFLRHKRVLDALRAEPCPVPSLIDGRMRPVEWLRCGSALLKSDFEHHGQGKTELNVSDPAYDLADLILRWDLSPAQEQHLLKRYLESSGDRNIEKRLFLYKLLAGTWSMARAFDNLRDPRLHARHGESNRQYIQAFDFLTEHTTRYCAGLCAQPAVLEWRSPLVVLDVDGVIDKQIFGFPSTTAAGIEALSLFHAHGFPIALNTARSLRQTREYCAAYGCVGGVAEYGSAVWDAIAGSERLLVSEESLRQIEDLRAALREIPGVFLNDDYEYSIRAFIYKNGVRVALPEMIIGNLMSILKSDRLELHQTFTDSSIVAAETNKGIGLGALLDLSGRRRTTETLAVGDSAPDLEMFRVAGRSYAPSHISCKQAAKLLRCQIVGSAWQRGLLEIARLIAHPHDDGGACDKCRDAVQRLRESSGPFADMLRISDRSPVSHLLRTVLDPAVLGVFRQ